MGWLPVQFVTEIYSRLNMATPGSFDSWTRQRYHLICVMQITNELFGSYDEVESLISNKGSRFHHVIKGFVIQGGDINGMGGESIYGPTFANENFLLEHDKKGMLSMFNSGPNTNNSQFFITMAPASHLNGRFVVFGQVIKGMEVLESVENIITEASGLPTLDVIIEDCGELHWLVHRDFDPEVTWWMSAVNAIKTRGDQHFKEKGYNNALSEYRLALAWLDVCGEKEDIDLGQMDFIRKTKYDILTNSSANPWCEDTASINSVFN